MNHKWDYGSSDRHSAVKRRCRVCWVKGTRPTRNEAWLTTSRGGVFLGSVRIPPCKGTPWVRYVHSDKSVSWILPGPRGIENDVPDKVLPVEWLARWSREQVEASMADQGLPPLPEEAWQVPA